MRHSVVSALSEEKIQIQARSRLPGGGGIWANVLRYRAGKRADLPSGHRELISVSYSSGLCTRAWESGPPGVRASWEHGSSHQGTGVSSPLYWSLLVSPSSFQTYKVHSTISAPVSRQGEVSPEPSTASFPLPAGKQDRGAIPWQSWATGQAHKAPDPQLSAPPAKRQLLGSKECWAIFGIFQRETSTFEFHSGLLSWAHCPQPGALSLPDQASGSTGGLFSVCFLLLLAGL